METLFFKPQTLEEALGLLDQFGSKALVVNGGTDAVLHLIEKKVSPEGIVSISALPDFHRIMSTEDSILIGGGVTYNELLADHALADHLGLYKAIMHLASPPIRAVATLAGNICTAAPSADCTTMLLALRATVHLASLYGQHTVPLQEYFISTYRTVRAPEELLTAIEIPRLSRGEGTGYCRLSRRKAQDIAKVLVGAWARMDGDQIQDISISLGALNPCVVHAAQLEELLRGKTAQQAAELCAATFPVEAKLRESYFKAYKQDVVCAAVSSAVNMAVGNAKGETA